LPLIFADITIFIIDISLILLIFSFSAIYWYYAIIDAISPLFLSFIFDFRHIISFRYFHFISPWYCAIIDDIDAMLSCRFRCHFHFSLYFDAAIISLIRWCHYSTYWLLLLTLLIFRWLIIDIDIDIIIFIFIYWYFRWYAITPLFSILFRHYLLMIIIDITLQIFQRHYRHYIIIDYWQLISLLILLLASWCHYAISPLRFQLRHYWHYAAISPLLSD
jgi:hypothetical protein